jgi:exodeoxyribonuclease VII large subunit
LNRQDVLDQIGAAAAKLRQALRYRLADAARRLHTRGMDRASSLLHRRIGRWLQRVDEADYALRASMRGLLALRRRLEIAYAAAAHSAQACLARAQARFRPVVAQLQPLSPLRVLERGYAIATDDSGRVLKDASEAPPESAIRVRLARGHLKARVTELLPNRDR